MGLALIKLIIFLLLGQFVYIDLLYCKLQISADMLKDDYTNLAFNTKDNLFDNSGAFIDGVLILDVEGLLFKFNNLGQLKWTSRLANKLISFKFHAFKHSKFIGHRRYLTPTIDGRVCYVDETKQPVCLPITVKDIVNYSPFTTTLLPSVYIVGNRHSTLLSESIEPLEIHESSNSSSGNLNVNFEPIDVTQSTEKYSTLMDNKFKNQKCLVNRFKAPFLQQLDCSVQELEDEFSDANQDDLSLDFEMANLNINNTFEVTSPSKEAILNKIDQLLISRVIWTVDAFDMATHVKLWSFTWAEICGLKGSLENVTSSSTEGSISLDVDTIKDIQLNSTELVNPSSINTSNYGNRDVSNSNFVLSGQKVLLYSASGAKILTFPFRLASMYSIKKVNTFTGAHYTISLMKNADVNDEFNLNFNALTNIANQDFQPNRLSPLLQITSVALVNEVSEPIDTWFFNLPENVSYDIYETSVVKSIDSHNNVPYKELSLEKIIEYIKLGIFKFYYMAWASIFLIISYIVVKIKRANNKRVGLDDEKPKIGADNDKIEKYNEDLNISFLENGRFTRTFSCEKLLGRGGFGAVYRAKHKLEPGNPEYAIKFVILRIKDTKDLTSRRCFREVAANRDIYSKYVVRYYTWWCENISFLPLVDYNSQISQSDKIHKHENNKLFNGVDMSNCYSLSIQAPTQDSLILFASDSESDSEVSGIREVDRDIKLIETDQALNNSPFRDKIYIDRHGEVDLDIKNGKRKSKRDKDIHVNDQNFQIVLVIQMELCNGCTLRQWLDCPSRPTTDPSNLRDKRIEIHLFIQLIKGLRDIHERGFIHRDIKPENIFVDVKKCHLKIGDFGLVGFVEDKAASAVFTIDSPNSLTNVPDRNRQIKRLSPIDSFENSQISNKGQVIGTPEYAAPEGGASCTDRADIYSASLILLEMLCPRFATIMERVATLEAFRKSKNVPNYVVEHMNDWYQLMTSMSQENPKLRPSAKELYRRIRDLHKFYNNKFT